MALGEIPQVEREGQALEGTPRNAGVHGARAQTLDVEPAPAQLEERITVAATELEGGLAGLGDQFRVDVRIGSAAP